MLQSAKLHPLGLCLPLGQGSQLQVAVSSGSVPGAGFTSRGELGQLQGQDLSFELLCVC